MAAPSLTRLSLARLTSCPLARHFATTRAQRKQEGDISDAFASMSGLKAEPLPDSFRELKLSLTSGHEAAVTASFHRLLRQLRQENDKIGRKGSSVIPQVHYQDLSHGIDQLKDEILLRGAVVVKGVVDRKQARQWKEDVEAYVSKNPHTRAFPQNDPQVYELYWSPPQLQARGHPNLLRVQQALMSSLWHLSSPSSLISISNPLSYADRLRIRRPGDKSFALGPHMDGGSVERWELEGYGKGGVYDPIFTGSYENYDPWDASGRVDAVNNRYDGLGPCSMFRMWQGWMGMSDSGPGEGTLLVNPLMRLATVYLLLRPFFRPIRSREECSRHDKFLDGDNWVFTAGEQMTSELQGAVPGHGQEFTDEMHPHLELNRTLVHVPKIQPGDYVAWHCDTIHAVDKMHAGIGDSSVMYIPVCPVTRLNAEYLVRQRQAFRDGTPGPDFPGGEGESRHVGRPAEETLRGWTNSLGLQAMGMDKLDVVSSGGDGEKKVVEEANQILGFQ